MNRVGKTKSFLLRMLKEMAEGEMLEDIVQQMREDLGEDAPTEAAVRMYLQGGNARGLDAYQQMVVLDKLLECAEVNFRTLCDLIRYRQLKAAGVVNTVEEFMALMRPDEDQDYEEGEYDL